MKKRLGDILLERGVIDALQLHSALSYQRKWGVPLGQVVVDQRFCSTEQVLEALAEQLGMETVDLDANQPERSLARHIPEKVAEAHRVVPLRVEPHGPREVALVVAIAAPASMASLDLVKSVSGNRRVVAKLATDASIRRAIAWVYRGEREEAPRRPGMEGFSLPEADESMTMLLGGSMAELTNMEAPRAAEEAGLPTLEPLQTWSGQPVPKLVAPAPRPAPATKLPAVTATRPEQVAQVLVYGWGAEAAAGLVKLLGSAGFTTEVASTDDLLASDETQVVVAPLPSMEALGRRVSAQVVVAAKTPEVDLPRAQAVGARGFLAAPVDPDLLVRAVRRLLRSADDDTFRGRGAARGSGYGGQPNDGRFGALGKPQRVQLQ